MKVWQELSRIPYGETISYGELACRIGSPRACRAVGQANNKNPLAIIIPCHRVIGKDGSLTGYASGLDKKPGSWVWKEIIPRDNNGNNTRNKEERTCPLVYRSACFHIQRFCRGSGTAAAIGGNTFQFFSRNPRGMALEHSIGKISEGARSHEEGGFGPVVAHTPYTYNLASVKPGKRMYASYTQR